MSTDIKALVTQLRERAADEDELDFTEGDAILMEFAADALASAIAERDEARAERERLARENDELRYADRVHLSAKLGMESRLTARAEASEARLEELTRERDEAKAEWKAARSRIMSVEHEDVGGPVKWKDIRHTFLHVMAGDDYNSALGQWKPRASLVQEGSE